MERNINSFQNICECKCSSKEYVYNWVYLKESKKNLEQSNLTFYLNELQGKNQSGKK